jgi:hypothetical protein
MGFFMALRLESSAELLRRDTRGTGTRTDEAESEQNIEHAEAADGAAERRMKHDMNERGKVAKEKVLFPESGPGEIEKQGSHFEANNNEQCAKNAIHE